MAIHMMICDKIAHVMTKMLLAILMMIVTIWLTCLELLVVAIHMMICDKMAHMLWP